MNSMSLIQSSDGQQHNKGNKFGAFQSIEKGRKRT